MAEYNKFVFDEIRRIGRAWFDANHEPWMDALTPEQKEFIFEKVGEVGGWRRLVDNKSVYQILKEIGVDPADYGEAPVVINPDLTIQPRKGLSLGALLVATVHNIDETIMRLVDAGANSTRINLLSALWDGVDCLPFTKTHIGWNLYFWNNQYFERLAEIKEKMNSNGIQIQWTNYELYSWSRRKTGPQQDNTPWRNNVNNVFWSKEDITFDILPDGWSKDWFKEICPLLGLEVNSFEIGNEFPEKALHERVRDEVRKIVPGALIQANRNDDTPGQYPNMMKPNNNYDFISFHGNRLKELSDLDRNYNDEPVYQTFKEFFDTCPHDPKKIIFSSDGARISADPTNTYDWDKLKEWFREMRRRGFSIEHQSRAKMTPAPNHHMIEVDWFKEVIS